jgi:hypothetical protein
VGGAAGAALALLAAMALLGPRPIDPDEGAAAPLALFLGLLGYYVAVALPFLLAGLAVVAPLAAWPERANRLYAADLLGAGLGCVLAVAALRFADGAAAVALCAAVFLAAAAAYASRARHRAWLAALSAAAIAAAPLADRVITFLPANTKALGRALRDPSTEVLFTRWSPVNRVDVYHTGEQRGGWWGAIGLSKRYAGPKPRTVSIQYDGHNGSDIQDTREPDALRMLDEHLLRAPYALREQLRVLVIGVGGGIDVQNALRRGVRHVTGVDLQPITIELHRGLLAPWTGGLASRPEVELVAAEGRHFVRSHDGRYDLVQITAVDTFSAQTTGAYVLAESYLYTVEAFEDYFRRLEPDGMVSVILGDLVQDGMAPPLVTRLALIARSALERSGVADARRQILILTQPLGTASVHGLIAKKAPFSQDELSRARAFARANGFVIELSPQGGSSAPIRNIVHSGPEALASTLREQPFALEPATDDRPFFFHVLRWGSLLGGERIYWMFPGSATGLLVLAAMLVQALLVGTLLILLPLRGLGAGGVGVARASRFLLYFLGLGLGFLLIEISFVQKYVLVLGYPTYSLSVTIFALLVSAALGAFLSRRGWARPRRFLAGLLGATAALVALEVSILPWVRDALLGASLPLRIAITAALQVPLGVALGMYFPTGLEMARRHEPRLVPWAWAVNGVASVAATVLAVILGMQLGFSQVALLAVAIYALGTLALWGLLPPDPRRSAAS